MEIVFLDTDTVGIIPNIHLLDQFGHLTCYQNTSQDETLERIKDADIVITNKVVINEETITGAENLKLICVAATGMNNIDKTAAMNRGIQVCNVSDYSTNSVAQGTFAMLLHILHKISYFDNYVKEGSYSQSTIFTHFGRTFWELTGKRFGIIGMGNIGRQVAKIAVAFGAEVVYYSASGKNNQQPYLQLELEEVLRTSDVVSVHAPLNTDTENLLDYDRLKVMKRSAILLNAGRGGIVNEADLAIALNEGLIAGAGIDVFTREPILPENPLLKVDNTEKIVLMPHVTWASLESRTILVEKLCTNIEKFIKEENRTIKL